MYSVPRIVWPENSANKAWKAVAQLLTTVEVNNYCHSTYDWSETENDPSIMYLEMGDNTESEYQVIFHSYTGSLVYFYVDKTSGNTRIIEYVPTLDKEDDAGTIYYLFDYLEKQD